MDAYYSFGNWVQTRRNQLRLSRTALAKKVGCSPETVKKIERDERRPSLQVAELLAEHLQIPQPVKKDFLRWARGEFVPHIVSPVEVDITWHLNTLRLGSEDLSDRFVVEELIGEGGHGQVYRGRDTKTSTPVAIKRLKENLLQDKQIVQRFVQEGEALSLLNHPNIVKMLATYQADGQQNIVLEYVEGGSLRDLLEQKIPIDMNQTINIGIELADALVQVHHLGIVHRDIKPSNVLIASNGSPRLTDFGIAKIINKQTRLTMTNSFVGSPYYVSPEMLQGEEIDLRSDIWSLGMLFYEMVVGRRPFEDGQLAAIIAQILYKPIPHIGTFKPDIPSSLSTLITMMLAKERHKRPNSMRQVGAQLEAIKSGKQTMLIWENNSSFGASQRYNSLQENRNSWFFDDTFYQHIIDKLTSKTNRTLEERFVKLTLFLDQGEETFGPRFTLSKRTEHTFDTLEEVIDKNPIKVFILLGNPGSGKSTLLENYQFQLAKKGLSGKTEKIPFFVRLNRYRHKSNQLLTPMAWLQTEWEAQHSSIEPKLSFETLLNNGRLVILLDGLNEIPHAGHEEYEDRVQEWSDFVSSRLGENLAIFSCRTLDYSAPFSERNDLEVQQVQVLPLNRAQIAEFLEKYSSAGLAKKVMAKIHQDPKQINLYSTPLYLRILIEQVDGIGEVPVGRAALLTGFVRQLLQQELIKRQNQFLESGNLLNYMELRQVKQKRWGLSPYALLAGSKLIEGLTYLAYGMQLGQGSDGGMVSLPWAEIDMLISEYFGDQTDPNVTIHLVESGRILNILTEELGNEGINFRFTHQLIQEYFAARRLAKEPDVQKVALIHTEENYFRDIGNLPRGKPIYELPTTGWEETTILAVEMQNNPSAYLRRLMEVNLTVAARAAVSSEVLVRLDETLLTELKMKLLDRMQDSAFDLRDRLSAGFLLGEIGDPRFRTMISEEGVSYTLPPFVVVEAGHYFMGEDESNIKSAKPRHTINVNYSFEVAIFPVTNAEYKAFIDAGGYEDERWWETEASKKWRSGVGTAEADREYWRFYREMFLAAQLTSQTIAEWTNISDEEREIYTVLIESNDEQFNIWLFDKFKENKR